MILKSEGIILRVLPYSKTSLMADCLIRDTGRVWLLAKGAQRPRSQFIGQIDLFYTCEVLFYQKASRVLILKECAALDTRDAFRRDWRAAACASYFCDFTAQVTPPGVPHDDLYDLLTKALDALANRSVSSGLMGWYELAALKALGLGLSLSQCPLCGRDPAADGLRRLKISSRQGGVLCKRCEPRETTAFTDVSAGTLALLRSWERTDDPQVAAVVIPSQIQWSEIQTVLKDFSAYHLDLPLRSRELTLDWLNQLK
jgi:DNA repair protein RecO (recombination protein O)